MFIDTRSEFIFRDPDALEALLQYDWRTRLVLTDGEVVGEPGRPGAVRGTDGSSAILRHMQRLNCIKALHGVRRQGGRMRLWRVEQVLKLQAALDLKGLTGERMSACAEALAGPAAEAVEAAVAGWRRHVGTAAPSPAAPARLRRYEAGLLADPPRVARAVETSVRRFVAENRFDAVEAPAFLL
ncbi:hypothetical protein E5163_02570 [Marinicauda algicola]|uniref:Uncharacterized protein n=1 Tax=Marinicauda algicola TaxID=2029849 RepID=A0A4S2H3F6_9PROT|nr:hypothetical protein [Marinicauda algicola]TGY90033.1 hypothetical protein E5163_02570 [Marinicauda algicola]